MQQDLVQDEVEEDDDAAEDQEYESLDIEELIQDDTIVEKAYTNHSRLPKEKHSN